MVASNDNVYWNTVSYGKHRVSEKKSLDICDSKFSLLEEEVVVNDVKSYYRQLKEQKQAIKKSYQDSDNNLVIEVGDSKFVYPKKAGIMLFTHDLSKVLLVNTKHYENEECIWSLPKGHVEDGESNWETAKRETLEETGLLIDIQEQDPSIKLNNTVFYCYIGDEHEIYSTISNYKSDEIVECKWVSIADIRKTRVTKETLVMCTKKHKLAQKVAKHL